MTKKHKEGFADLAYAIRYLEDITECNNPVALMRAKELVEQAYNKLKPKTATLPGRVWRDDRRIKVLAASEKVVEFNRLTQAQVNKLYDIVVHEHENWDGEEVSVESVLTFMVARYNAVGLAPSRN